MNELTKYEDMWTTELGRYALIDMGGEGAGRWLIFDLEAGGPCVVDDSDEVLVALAEKLLSAGTKVMSPEEAEPPE